MKTHQLLYSLRKIIRDNPKQLEYFTIHQQRYNIILRAIEKLPLEKNAKVLDIGCYPPHLFYLLQKKPFSFSVTGISSIHEPIHKRNIIQLNIEKERLPFLANTFDLVIMSEVIEHLVANPSVYLSEIKRVLKKKGFFLITTPNAVHIKHRINLLFGKSIYFPLSQLYTTNIYDDSIYYRHNREFTMDELCTILRREKFRLISSQFTSFYTPFRKGRKKNIISIFGFFLSQLYPSFKDSLYILSTI